MTHTSNPTARLATIKMFHGGTIRTGAADIFMFNLLREELIASIKENPSLVTDDVINQLCELALNHVHADAEIAQKMASGALYVLLTAAQANPAKGPVIVASLESLAAELLNGIPPGSAFVDNRKCYTSQSAVGTIGSMLNIAGVTQNMALAALQRLALESPDARLRYDAQGTLHDHACIRHISLKRNKQNNTPPTAEKAQDLAPADFATLVKNTSDQDSTVQLKALSMLLESHSGKLFNMTQLRALVPVFEKAATKASNDAQVELVMAARSIKQRLLAH